MRALPAALYADLVGKPFERGARGPYAYDCVGLAAELQRRRGVCLPGFLSDEAELHRQLAAGGVLSDTRRLDGPEAGCIVLVRMLEDERHIGVMLDPFRMLHTTEQTKAAVIERTLDPLWKRRILGFYTMEPA